MSNLQKHLQHARDRAELLTVFGITEAEVQSTAVKGFPVSGQQTQLPTGVARSDTAETPNMAPGDPGAPPEENNNHQPESLDTEAGEEVCDAEGGDHQQVEAEFFASLSDILSSFQGFMSGCNGEQYDVVNQSVDALKQALEAHTKSYQPEAPADGAAATPPMRMPAASTVAESRQLNEERGEFFDSRLFKNSTVYYIGTGASQSQDGEPSADYIWCADLQGDGNYIEFVVQGRIVVEIDAPKMRDISRKFKPAMMKWLDAIDAPKSPELEREANMIMLAYSQAVAQVERNNGRGY